jgi:hypothetical protein
MPYATRRSYSGASAACTLTSSITSGDTTATLTGTTTAWPATAGGPFYMVIDPGLSTEEKVLVGARSTGSLSSITRGVDGTTASSHSAGATCYPVFTAVDADQANKIASTLTTKGDIFVTDGTAITRYPISDNRKVLTADSAQTYGFDWEYPSDLTLNAQTGTTYTFVAADTGKFVTCNNGSAITVTIPTNAAVPFLVGTQINVLQLGAGQITFGGAGVTMYAQGSKTKTFGQYSVATLVKIATDTWVLCGNIA